jgi:hypothetical protein
MPAYKEEDDGCYWKLLLMDDMEETYAEMDRCNKAGIRLQIARIRDEDGKEYMTVAKRVPIGT